MVDDPKKAEAARKASTPDGAGLAALGRMAAELLHDLAGGLSLLSARIGVARKEAERGEIPHSELEAVQQESDELRAMMLEILDEVRGASGGSRPTFSPAAEVERAIDRWYRAGSAVPTLFNADLPEDALVRGPRTLFARAVSNLLRNASRHARSRVSVSLCRIDGSGEAPWLELRVEDDGAGIPPQMIAELFRPFSAGVPGGHGLGLSFASWAAERLQGSLEHAGASTRLGGATFVLRVPLAPPPQADASLAGASARAFGPGPSTRAGTVLVVDDDGAVCTALCRRLRREGLDARAIPVRGVDTLAGLADQVAEVARSAPCVALVDWNLGHVKGPALARAIAARAGSAAGIVLMTGGDVQALSSLGLPVIHKLDPWAATLGVLDAALVRVTLSQPPH
jgi:CheY-like chemotaxis protein